MTTNMTVTLALFMNLKVTDTFDLAADQKVKMALSVNMTLQMIDCLT